MGSKTGETTTTQSNQSFDLLLTHLLSDFIVSDIDDIDLVVHKGLETAARFFNVDEAYIGILNDKKTDWRCFYKWTEDGGLVKGKDNFTLPLSSFPWSKKYVQSGKGIKEDNLAESKLLRGKPDFAVYLQAGLKSVLIEPLSVKKKIVPGVIALWSRKRNVKWGKDDAMNLRLLGDVLANLMAHNLSEDERRKREKYISLLNRFTQYAFDTVDYNNVLTKMSEDFLELTGADYCGFGILNEDQKTISPIGVSGWNAESFSKIGEIPAIGSITERVLRSGKPLVLEKITESKYKDNIIAQSAPVHSMIAVPLRTAKKRIGSIMVGYINPHSFKEQEIEMYQQAAAQITLSLNNIQAYTENALHIEEMNTLSIMSTALRKAQSLAEIPGKVIDRIITMRLAESAGMILFKDPNQKPGLIEGGGSWHLVSKDELEAGLL